MPSCEGCNWRVHYDMKLQELEDMIAKFPPRHADAGLAYDRKEIDDWREKAQTIVKKEQGRKYR